MATVAARRTHDCQPQNGNPAHTAGQSRTPGETNISYLRGDSLLVDFPWMSFHFFEIPPASVAGGSREVGFAGWATRAHL